MVERLVIAGSGGQGIVLIGRVFATVAVETVPFITFFPAYGAEVRGGVSSCQVILSSREIASPVSEVFDSMILMNPESVERFSSQRGPDCLTVVNASLCSPPPGPNVARVSATDMANELGDVRAANFIMLGAYLALRPLVPLAAAEDGVRQGFAGKPVALVRLNLDALRAGFSRVAKT
jgi:2-oxoglutarate ferredoxin oxidoreductase subunit gamma